MLTKKHYILFGIFIIVLLYKGINLYNKYTNPITCNIKTVELSKEEMKEIIDSKIKTMKEDGENPKEFEKLDINNLLGLKFETGFTNNTFDIFTKVYYRPVINSNDDGEHVNYIIKKSNPLFLFTLKPNEKIGGNIFIITKKTDYFKVKLNLNILNKTLFLVSWKNKTDNKKYYHVCEAGN